MSCPHLSLIRNTRRPQKRQRRPQRQRRRRDDFPTMELLARQKASLSLSSSSTTTTITTPTCRLGRRLRRQPLSRRRVETSSFTSSSETSSSEASSKDIDAATLLMERQQVTFIDMRSAKAYDKEHIVKPPRQTVNVPYVEGEDTLESFTSKVTTKYANPGSAKLLMVDADGTKGIEVARKMREELGYEHVFGVNGGYDGWMAKWTPSGRKRPPKGRFVSTGRESLKSGLDLNPEVAATYEENWGNPDASFAANSNQLKEK